MPPIVSLCILLFELSLTHGRDRQINSDLTKISLDTTSVFIDVTATDETKLGYVLDVLVTMFSEYCSEPFTFVFASLKTVQLIESSLRAVWNPCVSSTRPDHLRALEPFKLPISPHDPSSLELPTSTPAPDSLSPETTSSLSSPRWVSTRQSPSPGRLSSPSTRPLSTRSTNPIFSTSSFLPLVRTFSTNAISWKMRQSRTDSTT